jgi:hypothetical protein
MSSFRDSWKNNLLCNPEMAASDKHFSKINDLADPGMEFETAFKVVSKNPGISFISLDPTESSIQLFHHCHVIGGNWDSPNKSISGILGVGDAARPIQIITKSVKIIKMKSLTFLR